MTQNLSPPIDISSPREAGHLHQFRFGFTLVARIGRALLQNPADRKAFLHQALTRTGVTLSVTLVLTLANYTTITALLNSKQKVLDLNALQELGTVLLASVYSTLCMVEWCVIALTRDYDDQISRRASLLLGLTPEDPERAPRVRFDFKWLKKKILRRFRGYRVYLVAMPAAALLMLIPLVGTRLYSMLIALWSLYWTVVYTAAKSAAAWRDEEHAPDPWFIAGWMWLATRVPGFRWTLPRAYGRWWRRQSKDMFSPCHAVALHPSAMAGLALFRFLCDFPGAYLFARPFLPVAAAYILRPLPEAEIPKLEEDLSVSGAMPIDQEAGPAQESTAAPAQPKNEPPP